MGGSPEASGQYLNPGRYLDGPTAAMDSVPFIPEPKKVLVLHVEVPGVWVDDLDAMADEHFEGDYFDAVTDGMGLNEQVGLTVLIEGDESGPMVQAYSCRVVAAEVMDRG